MADFSYSFPMFGDDEDEGSPLKKIMSPVSAEELVKTPPNTPPQSGPGQSTPRTGSLDYSPQQAMPKRSGPDMIPGRAPLPENLSASYSQQSASTGISSGGARTVVRDLAGNPAGSSLSTLTARPSGIAGVLAAQLRGQPAETQQASAQPQAGPAPVMPVNGGPIGPALRPAGSSVMPVSATRPGVMPVQPQGAQLNSAGPSMIQPKLDAQTSAYGNMMQLRRQYPGPSSPGLMPASTGSGPGAMPVLPNTASPVAPANQQRLARDQARLDYLTGSGSGISQIKNPVGRGFARAGDVALSLVAPAAEPLIGGTEGRHQLLIGRQQGVVGNDEDQIQRAAQAADTASQTDERNAQGRRYDAQANLYNPEPMTAGQAQTLGHPEWEGLRLDARDAERLIGGAAHNDTTLQTHFGGQQKTLSQGDAEAINMPSLAGKSMSNDEYQKTLQQVQRNTQSDTNNTRTNNTRITTTGMNDATRVQTTGMRDSTSTANSERNHPNAGSAKPIPPAIRDRIESQKNLAINKARAKLDSGESSMDDYLNDWQGAQNDYEDRLSAQTGGPIPHTDIRKNVDSRGNWAGGQQGNQPQAQSAANSAGFITHKGSRVAVGDPVNVNGRKGTVTGFNPKTGKAQVEWKSGD